MRKEREPTPFTGAGDLALQSESTMSAAVGTELLASRNEAMMHRPCRTATW